MAILAFPSSHVDSISFAREARSWGHEVIGASSLSFEPLAGEYDGWVRLPFIHDTGFFEELEKAIACHHVRCIYTPHAPTYYLLERELPRRFPDLDLRGEAPNREQMFRARERFALGEHWLKEMTARLGRELDLTPGFIGAVLGQARHIYGECSDEKAAALCAIGCFAPKGDVVEIGSFFGKSAYILNRVAASFAIGPTIAIDAWDAETSVQRDSPETIQALSYAWDWQIVFESFVMTMQACSSGSFNCIRAPSRAAHQVYREGTIASREFGRTEVLASIAILHIDANHDESAVEQDFRIWSQHLSPGGWLVFDDYEWSQGDGPRKVADRAIAEYGARVSQQFRAGGAMFLKVEA